MLYKCFVVFAAFFAVCNKQGSGKNAQAYEWKKIVLPGEGLVASFYGDIYDRMIVGTNQNIVRFTDSGRSLQIVAANVDQVSELIMKNDTLFALSLGIDHYSLNKGDSWQKLPYARVPELYRGKNAVKISTGKLFRLERKNDGEIALPVNVLMSENAGTDWKNVFPYKHNIIMLFADARDKVYLGIFGAVWKEQKGFVAKNPEDAIIYYLDK
jgi:hypothetical protein